MFLIRDLIKSDPPHNPLKEESPASWLPIPSGNQGSQQHCMNGAPPVPGLTLSLELFPLSSWHSVWIQYGSSPREYIVTVLSGGGRNRSVIIWICNAHPYRHSWPPLSESEPHLHASRSPPSPPSLPSPAMDLLSHPTLGVRRTRGSSSKVRVARQGTEFSSGLRALVSEAEDRRRRTHEQPQPGWGWKR